jgi:UDP-glucose 4-epimerase
MTNILITGSAGLLGNHLSRHLISQGHRVIGVDNLSGGYADLMTKDKNFTFYQGGLEDLDFVKGIYQQEKPEVTYHFAAYAAEGLSPFIRKYNYMNNVVAGANVVTNCIETGSKLISASSMAVYGSQPTPFKEDLLPAPIDPYGIAKYAIEMDIASAGSQFGMPWTVVRPHNVLGIYQNIWDRYRNVMGIFIRRTLRGEPILVYGDGMQKRAFSDVKYYMDPFTKLMDDEHNGEIYNIGADQEVTLIDMAKLVQSIARKRGIIQTIIHTEPRHEVVAAWCDHAKAKDRLDFQDSTDLESLVNEMFDWAISQPSRPVKNMPYEHTRGLYSFWK